ncbi:MAG: LacI family DNA-binding transcriptional regulator [Candidatus Acetothermia bacterium]
MATMKDVARLADVSITTVSHVINDTRYVSPELTERVDKAIEELNYHPDPIAQGLSKGKSQMIALMVSDISNPFFPHIARGVEDYTREKEFNLILSNTDENSQQEKQNISLLKSKRVDGFIISPTDEGHEVLSSLLVEGIPLVIIDRKMKDLEVDQVYSDNKDGGYKATQHLIDRGHKDIGIILEYSGISSFNERLKGYKEALSDNGINVRQDLIRQAGMEVEGAYETTRTLLKAHPEVSAIFSTNDLMTEGVLLYFKEVGVRCPDDVALVGFDDPNWAASFNPAITAVAQQPYEMGYQAAKLLFEQLHGEDEPRPPRIVELQTELKVRESS